MAVISYGSQGAAEISEATGTVINSDDPTEVYSDASVVPREGTSAPLVPSKKVISRRTASVSALGAASASQTGWCRMILIF